MEAVKESFELNNQGDEVGCSASASYVLAFDTANEVVALGVGLLRPAARSIEVVASVELAAHRASNTQLLPLLDAELASWGVARNQIVCVAVGRGPGSFTGVRIAMATAKGIASALGVGLIGVSTLDAIAWKAQLEGVRGELEVLADAMRKEVYPVRFLLDDAGIGRQGADCVMAASAAAEMLAASEKGASLQITGDALKKYAELFEPCGAFLEERLWTPTGQGLLLALQDAWQSGAADPFDAVRHNPGLALPVYTRLSDAEENERLRLAKDEQKNLRTGVQDQPGREAACDAGASWRFLPLEVRHLPELVQLEQHIMGSEAWSQALYADELGRRDRTWWVCETQNAACGEAGPVLIGYAGGMVIDGDLQIFKVGVDPQHRRQGIARQLLTRVAADARNLGAETCSLEVRQSNAGARAFYEGLGLQDIGKRPRYYSDGEDARILKGLVAQLAVDGPSLEGMGLRAEVRGAAPQPLDERRRPLILAIESSCDETAAALVDGEGMLLADVVASQIDFHARFGGVVPEIASRKHIEAICGVCDECLEVAAKSLSRKALSWKDLDAVAVTYAPGLVGALVVGVAFAKGAAWAAEKPFIGVNHLEGHLYANKIGAPDFAPPAVVSLVSGGNTLLVHMKDWGSYETLGATIDDAVGEAFDKVAKALGLGYPGGPVISRYAKEGNPQAIPFPRAMMHSGDLRFSLSGLKTAVITYINVEREAGHALNLPDIAASFQQAVIDVQISKAKTALQQTGAQTFCLGGGVAANPALRQAYEKLCASLGVKLVMPPLSACGDNAAMISLVALDRFAQGRFFGLDADAFAHANLDEPY